MVFEPPSRTRVRIVHVSDLHLEPDGDEQYPGLYQRMMEVRTEITALSPDLVVATGDLTNRGSDERSHFSLAFDWLESLQLPWLAVPGNHDLGATVERGAAFPRTERYEDVPFAATGYAATFGSDPIVQARLGDLLVVGIALRDGDPDGVLDRLETIIASAGTPVVLAGHYPVVDVRQVRSDEPFGARGYVDSSAEQLARILAASDQVIAYLCGHVHLTSTRAISSRCMQFTAGGLGPGAAAFRIHEWDGADWRYATQDVAGPTTFWESGLAEARADPLFSSGAPHERTGIHTPHATTSPKETP